MNGQRWAIVVAFAAILHNALRAAATILGAPWGFFTYLRPFHVRVLSGEVIAQLAGLAAILIFAAVFARFIWRKAVSRGALWSSSLFAAATGATLGLLATYVSASVDKSYGRPRFIAGSFVVGFGA